MLAKTRNTSKGVRNAAATRQRILVGARDVFLIHGFGGATATLIQKTAQVSRSTLYKYFPHKYDLFTSCMEMDISGFLPRIDQKSAESKSISDFLLIFGVEFVSSLLSAEGIQLSRLAISERQRFPALGQIFLQSAIRPTHTYLEKHLADAHRNKELTIRNTSIATDQFLGMLRGEIYFECLLGERTPPASQLERLVAFHVDTFIAAYRPAK